MAAAVLAGAAGLMGCQNKDPNATTRGDAPVADGGALDTRAAAASDRMGRYPSQSPSMRGTTTVGNTGPGADGTVNGSTGVGTGTTGAAVGTGTPPNASGVDTGSGAGTRVTPQTTTGSGAAVGGGAASGAAGGVDVGTREAAGSNTTGTGAGSTSGVGSTGGAAPPRTDGQSVIQGETPADGTLRQTPPTPRSPNAPPPTPSGNTNATGGQGTR